MQHRIIVIILVSSDLLNAISKTVYCELFSSFYIVRQHYIACLYWVFNQQFFFVKTEVEVFLTFLLLPVWSVKTGKIVFLSVFCNFGWQKFLLGQILLR